MNSFFEKINFKDLFINIGLFLDDKKTKDQLSATGGFIALGFSCVKLIDEYIQSKKSPSERTFLEIFKLLFNSSFSLLKDICFRFRIDEKDLKLISSSSNNKEILKEIILDYLKNDEIIKESNANHDSLWLPDHPLIQRYKKTLLSLLYDSPLVSKLKDEFNKNFEDELAAKIYENKEISQKLHQEMFYKQIDSHLNTLIEEYFKYFKGEPIDQSEDFFSTRNYYPQRNAILTSVENWLSDDNQLQKSGIDMFPIEDKINAYLEDPSNSKLLIGASFGIGKTSLVKRISYLCAKERIKRGNAWIPIIVNAKDKGSILKGDEYVPLNEYLDHLFQTSNLEHSREKKILLIVDALDEYPDLVNKFLENVKRMVQGYSNIKYILTSRLVEGIPESVGVIRYVRLLPFSLNQAAEILSLYHSGTTLSQLKGNGFSDEELTRPLIIWMLAFTYPKLEMDFKTLKENRKITSKVSKTIIYLNLFHNLLEGSHFLSRRKQEITDKFIKEKQSLRILSYMKQINDEINIDRIKTLFSIEVSSDLFDRIIYTYLYKDNKKEIDTIEFVHKSFQEFFLAEFYIENYIKSNFKYIYIGKPTEVTVDFITGFLELLNSRNESIIKKYFTYNKENPLSLLYSFNCNQDINKVIEKIRENAQKIFDKELISTVNFKDYVTINLSETNNEKNLFLLFNSQDNSANSYENLWIHRWLSLRIFGILSNGLIGIDKTKLERMIKSSSHAIPHYLKYLLGADLSDTDLSHSDLSKSDLSHANLSKANLYGSRLTHANLYRSNLKGANMSLTDLFQANIINVDMSNTILIFAKLALTKLQECLMSNCIIICPDFHKSKLIKLKLLNSIIINPVNYDDMFVEDLDINNTIIDDPFFIDCLKVRIRHIPERIENKRVLKRRLNSMDINPGKYLGYSKLPN